MKKDHSTSFKKTTGSDCPNLASSGSLHIQDIPPCTGPQVKDARPTPALERLGSLLYDWLESIGYNSTLPAAEKPSVARLPFSGNQLREIDRHIARLKTEATHGNKASEPIFLDNVDLMKILHISPRTSRLWREKGWLSYSRVGRKLFFRLEDVERMLEEKRVRKK